MAKFFSSLMLAFVLFAAYSHAAKKAVEIGEFCKQTKNPSFCVSLLNSSQGGKDLVSFGQFTINVAQANVTKTLALLKSLVAKSSKDPKAQTHYEKCLEHFDSHDGVVGDLEDTQEAFKTGDYLGAALRSSDIILDVDDCILSKYGGESPFHHDRSLLPKYGGVLKQVADIIHVISINLRVYVVQ